MNADAHPECLLLGLPGSRPRELAAEIAGMRTALECVTDGATTDQIHGRIDSLLQERVVELNAYLSAAMADEGAADGEHNHG
ncbi:MAG: hypothetical protein ACREPV_01275 [Lysobacter sp.]